MSKVGGWCVDAAATGVESSFGKVLFAALEDGGGEVGDVGGVAEDGHLGDEVLGGSPDFSFALVNVAETVRVLISL